MCYTEGLGFTGSFIRTRVYPVPVSHPSSDSNPSALSHASCPTGEGLQEAPRTAVIIDEANLAMPNGDADAGATGVVQSLLRASLLAARCTCTAEHSLTRC